jgi:hypothetical protein
MLIYVDALSTLNALEDFAHAGGRDPHLDLLFATAGNH